MTFTSTLGEEKGLLPLIFRYACIAGSALVPAVSQLLDPAAFVVGVVSGVVAVALEAELRVAAAEDELFPVAHGGFTGLIMFDGVCFQRG